MTCYGKALVSTPDDFELWVAATTREILNESCEDENEITEMLKGSPPDEFPAVIVWWYVQHSIFVEYVLRKDFAQEKACPGA